MYKVTSILFIVLAIVLGLIAVATLIDLVRALLVPNTLTAVESALGTAVIAIILAVMAIRLFKTGCRRLQDGEPQQN